MTDYWKILKDECHRLGREAEGVALVFTLGVFLFLYVLCCGVYSVGEQLRQKMELQNACDAAAYSGALVQADALSRMAVLNRAMAWTYIQTTKAQMDYITYKWLKEVRDRFRDDMKNRDETPASAFGTKEMGYHHFGDELSNYSGKWIDFGFNCKHGIHDNPDDIRARYIGLGPNTEGGANMLGQAVGGITGGAVGAPRDRHWIRINGQSATDRRLQYSETSRDLEYWEGGECKAQNLVGNLEKALGSGGDAARQTIRYGKWVISFCSGALDMVNGTLVQGKAIDTVIRNTLYENLPKGPDGRPDKALLDDYVYTFKPGTSAGPDAYTREVSKGKPSYFSALYNNEQDEMRFLAMANGIESNTQKLKDFFRSGGVDGGHLAAGLDQWFIRCEDTELANSSAIGVPRHLIPPNPGILRCYKNANYLEGRTPDGILRGNYCLDGDSPVDPGDFGDVDLRAPLGFGTLFPVNWIPRTRWQWIQYGVPWTREFIKVIRSLDGTVRGKRGNYGEFKGAISMYQNFKPSPAPSCINYRSRFGDQCANVRETVGLVAEYEWAAAYWFCFWVKFKRSLFGLNPFLCFHIPFPAAIYGGRVGDHYGQGDDPSSIFQAQREMFSPKRTVRNVNVSGWSRNAYHRTFIGGDAEPKFECWAGPLSDGMNGANMGSKGYVRIYGDDRNIVDDCYVGARAMPWVLNESFFNGSGTIVVGVARRQRNVFEWIFGTNSLNAAVSPVASNGLYSAFSPWASGGVPHLVALSAARAAYAPRIGKGKGDGPDSRNNPDYPGNGGGWWGRHYELRYDSVTDGVEGKFSPSFGANASNKETIEKKYRIGCVCGVSETGQRLRRQWNLCQTDWDAVLLPVRHASANPSKTDPSKTYDSLSNNRQTSWSFTGDDAAEKKDPQYSIYAEDLPKLEWFSFTGGTPIPFGKIAFEPHGLSVEDAYRLFKRRMIH